MSGWTNTRELVATELRQSLEEGKPAQQVAQLKSAWEKAGDHVPTLESIYNDLRLLPVDPSFPYNEPDDLQTIRSLRPTRPSLPSVADDATLLDRLHGAWLGRCAGCALGKPVEVFMHTKNGLLSWERQKAYLTAISPEEWPLRDYFPARSPAETTTGRTVCPDSTRDHIAFMESDDDIRYTVIGQITLKKYGRDFLPVHVARAWIEYLGYYHVCTAETQAYRNLVIATSDLRQNLDGEQGRIVNSKIDWSWISGHMNPYREWIGAQIRVDSYGYAAPGNPELAAEWAWRDARISHVKNGLYGAMFCAAMIAASFVTNDPRTIVEAGLAEIPATSRLAAALRTTIDLCAQHGNDPGRFEEVIRALYEKFNHYDPVHTINNAALCAAAVLLSGGDFSKGITIAVMGGWDSDCNGATVGSVVGAVQGASRCPEHWTGRLNNTLKSLVIGYDPIAISECAQRSLEIIRSFRNGS
jgi:ADP-ribosylglycohydrolase